MNFREQFAHSPSVGRFSTSCSCKDDDDEDDDGGVVVDVGAGGFCDPVADENDCCTTPILSKATAIAAGLFRLLCLRAIFDDLASRIDTIIFSFQFQSNLDMNCQSEIVETVRNLIESEKKEVLKCCWHFILVCVV